MPVIRKLTSTDQFCSEAHRQSYQEETNRLALDRLLNPKAKAKAEAGDGGARGRATATVDAESTREVAAAAPPAFTPSARAAVGHTRATAHHQFEIAVPPQRSAAGPASEQNVSDSRTDTKSKAVEPAARVLPMAGPIEIDPVGLPGGGGAPLRPIAEGAAAFPRAVSHGNLDLRGLATTGFEDEAGYATYTEVEWVEEPEPVASAPAVAFEALSGASESAIVPVVLKPVARAVPAPALMPVFQQAKQAAAPAFKTAAVSSNFDFEPLGDFLEMEEGDDYAIEAPAPAAAAPPPMAAGAIAGPPLDLKPAAPAAGKVQAGFDAVPCEPSSIHAPALALSPLRKKLVSGPNPNARPVAPVQPVVKQPPPPVIKPPAAMPQKPAAPSFTVKPAAAPVAAKPATAPKPVVTQAPPTARPEPIRPPAPQPAAAPARPAMAARDRSATAPVSMPVQTPVTAPAPKPSAPPKSAAPDAHDIFPTLGTTNSGFWANASGVVKIGISGAALAVVAFLGSYLMKSTPTTGAASVTSTTSAAAAAAMSMGGGGWATNWGQEAPGNKGKHIQIFRPSMSFTDYHIDLRGQIEKKAMGWIFRAANPKNYYVMKLEIVKPGRTPVVALVKYAVINGKEQTHTQVMLPPDMPLSMDMEFRVRTHVSGNKFTTHVQDKLVDYWTDDAIKVGGAGLYSEKDERARVKSELITP